MRRIFNYSETTLNVEDFATARDVMGRQSRLDVVFYSVANSKEDAVRKFLSTPALKNSSASWVRERTSEAASEGINAIIMDEAVYCFPESPPVLIGRYQDGNRWIAQPDFKEKYKEYYAHVNDDKRDHESYGVLHISRASCSQEVTLFGSSIPHRAIIQLSISHALLKREDGRDWIMADSKMPLIEVDMSANQFADAITALNQGSGTPVTIKFFNGKYMAETPFDNKRLQFDAEFEEKMSEITSETNRYYKQIHDILSQEHIGKADRAELKKMIGLIQQELRSNVPFIKRQFTEQMDKTVIEYKAEIDAFLEGKIRQLGLEGFKKELKALQHIAIDDKGEKQ